MQLGCRGPGAPGTQVGGGLIRSRLQPDGVDQARACPVTEHAHAVGRGHDGVKVFGRGGEREVDPHRLPDRERGHHRQAKPRHDPQCAQREHATRECRVIAGDPDEFAIGSDELHGHRVRGQAAQVSARAVSAGAARASDRDVRQRREVGQRPAPRVQHPADFGVAHSGRHLSGRAGPVDGDVRGEVRRRDERTRRIRDTVERVSRSQRSHLPGPGHDLLQFRNRGGRRRTPVLNSTLPAQLRRFPAGLVLSN